MESLAEKIRELKDRTRPRRPIVIEFCGSPKSGKSSCISSLDIFLRRNGFRTRVLTEYASVCPIDDKFDPRFNLWTGTSALADLVEATWLGSAGTDVIIADRGIFDALTWFTWLEQHSNLDQDNYKRFVDFLTAPIFRSAIDLVYVFTANPRASMDREYATLLTRRKGSVMNDDVLQSYLTSVDIASEEFGPLFRSVERIDTSDIGQNDVSHRVTSQILQSLHDLVVERVGFFPRTALPTVRQNGIIDPDLLEDLPIEFDYRGAVEDDTSCVQPIPVLVLMTSDGTKVLTVKKRDESVSEDSPERNKTLIYAGGHVREEDGLGVAAKGFLALCRAALEREVKEELGLSLSLTLDPMFAILDKSLPKSEQHMAIVFVYGMEESEARVRLDTYEFIQKKGTTKSGHFLTVDEVGREIEGRKGEAWSRLILRELHDRNLLSGQFQPSLEV